MTWQDEDGGPANQGQNDNGNITSYPVPRIPLLDTKTRVIVGKESSNILVLR